MPRWIAALVRHGEYEQPPEVPSSHLPHPLTESGRDQARRGAEEILARAEEENWWIAPVIDSSRMLRAWQTAETMRNRLQTALARKFRVEEFPELAERSVGAAANLTLEEIERVLLRDPRYDPPPEDWKRNSHYRLPLQAAESLLESGVRVARHLEARLSDLEVGKGEGTLKIFVGHGGSFRHGALELGVLDVEEIPRLSMFHCCPIYLERTSRGRWAHLSGEWKVREETEGND